MKNLLRWFLPQWMINNFYHLPEAILANFEYGFPSKKLRVIGVTGTDGKTTVVNMVYRILKDAGKGVSMISTINAEIGTKRFDTGFHVTTPPESEIQRYLKMAADNGDEFFVLEVTSHALSQFRVWGMNFEVGIITNITHEHLDYHKTFENYLKIKAKLIKNVKWAVLGRDDTNFDRLKKMTSGQVLSFGLSANANLNPKTFPLNLKIPGEFNMQNALAAAGCTKAIGVDEMLIKKSLESFISLPGRMEEIKNDNDIKVVVDFAHTPNALENVLRTLKKQTRGRLISVFGAASERDSKKRPLMGEISAKLADITVLTDEDPRFESSEKIINEIAEGAFKIGAEDNVNLFKIPDRAKAIKQAINLAKKGDIVGIFGKGHEKSMDYQGRELPWSDQKMALQALRYGREN